MKHRELDPEDFNRTVWRYMPFAKFISLLTYQALWFSKLSILQDEYEGLIPSVVKKRMRKENQQWKAVFDAPELQSQIDAWPTKNENDGRELSVVTCWFLSETESQRMWEDYGGSNEAVAVKSTIGRLAKCIRVPQDEAVSQLGRVTYVDHNSHDMGSYVAAQAIERAFLKDKASFSHEQEVRLVTFNVKTTACVSPDGKLYTNEQVAGVKMNNYENPGLYVAVDLDDLITGIVVSPLAQEWFERLVRRIVELEGLSAPVSRSQLQPLTQKTP